MRERNEMILADLIQIRAEQQPELDVLTFEHLSLDGGATTNEPLVEGSPPYQGGVRGGSGTARQQPPPGPLLGKEGVHWPNRPGPNRWSGSQDEVRTFADLHTNANRIAAGLIRKGLARGDRLAVMMRNHPELVEAMVAASITGALFVPIDPRTRGEKLAFMLHNAGCSGIICADYCLAEVHAVRRQIADVKWILALETKEDAPSLSSLSGVEPLGELLSKSAAIVDVRVDSPDAPLQIMYTSGTTGDPKGIVGANVRFCAAGMLGMLFGYQPDERPYTGLSLTHGNAQAVTLAPALTMGLRAVFSRRFTKSKLWDVCRAHGCTTFSLVGGMATAIYSEPVRPTDADNSVRMVVSGGMPPAIWAAFERRFAVKILEFYGAMDGGGMAYKPIGEGPIGSFGKPMPGIEMKILDEEGNECPPGVVGEICCRPAGGGEASVEYYANPEASAEKIRSGWNRSGDMGHRDTNGWLFFDYRAGGGIRHNGDFINPSFVEKVIAEHPAVADVFVYGVPAASGAPGEKDVVAVIAPAAGSRFDAPSIFATCREKLEANFVPTYLQVVDEIPKTASEKPVERLLTEQFDSRDENVYTEKSES